jgi:hypothetical protein
LAQSSRKAAGHVSHDNPLGVGRLLPTAYCWNPPRWPLVSSFPAGSLSAAAHEKEPLENRSFMGAVSNLAKQTVGAGKGQRERSWTWTWTLAWMFG